MGIRERRVPLGFVATAILVLAVLWILQIVGTWYQMRHYGSVLRGITESSTEGYVGVGNAKASLGKGVILILVVGEDGTVTDARRMRGRTILARFEKTPDLVGMHVDELRLPEREGPYDAGTMLAARRAVEQVDRIKQEREVGAGVG